MLRSIQCKCISVRGGITLLLLTFVILHYLLLVAAPTIILDTPGIVNSTNKTVPQNERPPKTVLGGAAPHVLLLASAGRSGSSFLGGLLTSQPRVFYFFEPLRGLMLREMLTQESAIQGLHALFSCNITGSLSESVRDRSFSVMRTCRDGCYSEKKALKMCQRHPIRVVKTIRTRVAWLVPLLSDPTLDIKVIHLVRDPRPSLISAWSLGWNSSAQDTCKDIDQDMAAGRMLAKLYPESILAVRYEDLCVAPLEAAHTIFSFLGYEALPTSVKRFMGKFTSGRDEEPLFGIKRNSKEMQQQWRAKITEEELTSIESTCSQTINDMGFSLFHTLHDAKNMTLPLYYDGDGGGGKDSYFTVLGE